MKFGILGYGYVGKATHKGLIKELQPDCTILSKEVCVYDIGIDEEIVDVYGNSIPNIKEDESIDSLIKKIKDQTNYMKANLGGFN